MDRVFTIPEKLRWIPSYSLYEYTNLASGHISLGKTTTYYADNDITSGRVLEVSVRAGGRVYYKMAVVVEWEDWNEISWKQVDWRDWWDQIE